VGWGGGEPSNLSRRRSRQPGKKKLKREKKKQVVENGKYSGTVLVAPCQGKGNTLIAKRIPIRALKVSLGKEEGNAEKEKGKDWQFGKV